MSLVVDRIGLLWWSLIVAKPIAIHVPRCGKACSDLRSFLTFSFNVQRIFYTDFWYSDSDTKPQRAVSRDKVVYLL